MKLTDPRAIDKSGKELIDAIRMSVDWDVIRQLITKKHLDGPANRLEYRNGDLVVHDNRIAYLLDFEFQVPLSIVFNRDGDCLEIVSSPEDPATEGKSSREIMEIKERSNEKVEQLAASIADMINEINQSEESQ
ncbi:MAG: hypothetical protein AB1Z81_11380 [Desulfotignum sp.]